MQTSIKSLQFESVNELSILEPLKTQWRKTLTAPQDGMWEVLTNYATHWSIKIESKMIGYACVDGEDQLLQFFVQPEWIKEGPTLFKQFIQQENIHKALIGTNNPFCLSLAMHWQKSVVIHTYLFADFLKVAVTEKEGNPRAADSNDLENLIEFCHQSMGGPKDWLNSYLGNLISRGELFVLENGGETLGTCEVRKSESQPGIADLGVIVSPKHRRKGLGTYLLGKAKEIALQWNRAPICSCEKDNIGSLTMIQNNGFRSMHQMLLFKFSNELV